MVTPNLYISFEPKTSILYYTVLQLQNKNFGVSFCKLKNEKQKAYENKEEKYGVKRTRTAIYANYYD